MHINNSGTDDLPHESVLTYYQNGTLINTTNLYVVDEADMFPVYLHDLGAGVFTFFLNEVSIGATALTAQDVITSMQINAWSTPPANGCSNGFIEVAALTLPSCATNLQVVATGLQGSISTESEYSDGGLLVYNYAQLNAGDYHFEISNDLGVQKDTKITLLISPSTSQVAVTWSDPISSDCSSGAINIYYDTQDCVDNWIFSAHRTEDNYQLPIYINEALNIEWQKTLGTSAFECDCYAIETNDGGFIVVGSTGVNNLDILIIKLDHGGNQEWQRTLVGSSDVVNPQIVQSYDGAYVMCCTSDTGISGDKSEASEGGNDYWAVKLDVTGQNIEWDYSIGGSADDNFSSMSYNLNVHLLLCVTSSSGVSGDKNEPSNGWIVFTNDIRMAVRFIRLTHPQVFRSMVVVPNHQNWNQPVIQIRKRKLQ